MSNICLITSPEKGAPIYTLLNQQIPANRISEAVANPDALQIAYNVGVLELLSISLTFFAIMLGLAAFFGFWMIRGAAMKAAAKAATEESTAVAKRTAEDIAKQWIKDNAAEIFEEARRARGTIGPADEPIVAMTKEQEEIVIKASAEIKE